MLFPTGILLLILLFFWHGNHYETFGKKFVDIPKLHLMIDYIIIGAMIIAVIFMIRFGNKHASGIAAYERQKKKELKEKKSSL
jgi:hypothetical protein